ncbi:MAG: hypothetical protein SGI83_14640 [Bacteroidota bacterium]|nr:hypothetical protein [Bacteroidota bacterium]
MAFIYIGLILLAAFPMVLTIWRMRWAAKIKKSGIYTDSVVTHISTLRMPRAATMDILTLEYKDRATGKAYKGRATVAYMKYKIGDTMPVVYLPDRPAKYAIDTKKAYWAVLIFSIILFLFVLFAVYKIDEMVRTGQV